MEWDSVMMEQCSVQYEVLLCASEIVLVYVEYNGAHCMLC